MTGPGKLIFWLYRIIFGTMTVGKEMGMPVGMENILVTVDMLVNQVHPMEQIKILQDIAAGAFGGNGVIFFHDHRAIGNLFQNGKVMGRRDNRLAPPVQFAQNFHQPYLGSWIEPAGRLIQQKHIRVHGQEGGQGDFLLFPAAQLVRRAVGDFFQAEDGQHFPAPRERLLGRKIQLQRTKGDLIENRRAKQLGVRILEKKTDFLPEKGRESRFFEPLFRDRLAESPEDIEKSLPELMGEGGSDFGGGLDDL